MLVVPCADIDNFCSYVSIFLKAGTLTDNSVLLEGIDKRELWRRRVPHPQSYPKLKESRSVANDSTHACLDKYLLGSCMVWYANKISASEFNFMEQNV